MKTRSQRQNSSPAEEKGQLVFSSFDYRIYQAFIQLFHLQETEADRTGSQIHLLYQSGEELERLFRKIEERFSRNELEKISGRLITGYTPEQKQTTNFPVWQLKEQILRPKFVKIIQEQLFQSHLQPVLSTENEEIYGYELWLKPKSKLYPFETKELLTFAKKAGLDGVLDSQARITAIRTSAHKLERGVKRFINFLPSTITNPDQSLNSTFQAARDYGVAMDDIVFHVSRMENLRDVKHLYYIFNECRRAGAKTALTATAESVNFSSPHLQRLRPDIISIGRTLTSECHSNKEKLERIQHLKEAASQMGSLILACGVHSEEDYEALKPHADLVQGDFIGKPLTGPAKR